MNKREFVGAADTSLADWQQSEITKRKEIQLRIMLHGGAPEHSEHLEGIGAQGRTKREQIRDALEDIPYVREVVLALDPSLEPELFNSCAGTVVLIERNAQQRGARFELVLHAGQNDAPQKLFVFIPDGDRVPELQGDGFFATLVRDRVKPLHQWRYSDRDYEQCHLVQKAQDFVEGLRIEKEGDILSPPP